MANLNKKELIWKDIGVQKDNGERQLQNGQAQASPKTSVAGISKWSYQDIPTGKDEPFQLFSVFLSLSLKRKTAISLAGVVCPAIG